MNKSYRKEITDFKLNGISSTVRFVESMKVKEGVYCDVYEFLDDSSKDLGIVTVKPNSMTPRQKILKGKRTVEGYISGDGEFIIQRTDGKYETFKVKRGVTFEFDVNIGEVMQWKSTGKSDLVFYEICFPPYEDGRYENLNDE